MFGFMKRFFKQNYTCKHKNAETVVIHNCSRYRYSQTSFDQLERVVLRRTECPDCGLLKTKWIPIELQWRVEANSERPTFHDLKFPLPREATP